MDIHYGRKRSGIIKELQEKIEDWIESIQDDRIKKMVKKDTIVTGGAIASMLLGEPINDFDIYFRSLHTTLAVAEYYADRFNQKNKHAVEVRQEEAENIKGELEDRVIFYIESAGVAEEEKEEEDKNDERYRPVFISKNAITLSNKIQLVTRFYGEPSKIHDNYDFIHATCYWDHGTGDLVLPAGALEALLSRSLVYKGSLYPVASIFRLKKFIQRGWRVTAGEQLKIMWQISEIDLSDPLVMEEQLTGVDMVYLYELLAVLKEVDIEKINSTYVAAIIDRIFNQSGGE